MTRFYRGDLPAIPADVERVRRVLRAGPLNRKQLIELARLTQNRTLCAIDALIASGAAVFDATAGTFAIRE